MPTRSSRAPRRRRSRCTTAATSPSTSAPSRSAARTRPTSSVRGTCAVGTPLPIAADCTVILTFAPSALGLRTATLSIASDASNGTAVITLSGTGVPIPTPQVSLTPATLDFGTQTIGGLYPARRIRLANSGTADLAVGSIAASGAGFAIASSTCPAVLAPTAGCDIDIAFAPTAAQAFTGALTVTSNAAGSPHASVLRGSGSVAAVPVLVFSPAVTILDFGSVSAGSVSAAQTVTVLNQGPGGATLTLLNAIGGDASSFSVVGGTCAIGTTLFEATSCTISVQFAPGSSGTKTAQVQIASTGSFPPVLTLTGVGLAGPNPSLALSTAALDESQSGNGSMRGLSIGITDTTAQLMDQVAAYLADGYRRIKLKIEPGLDVERVRAVREANPHVMLSVDANAAYAVGDEHVFHALDEFGLVMIEQPLHHDDLLRHADLQERNQSDLCLDESIRSAARAQDALRLDSCPDHQHQAGPCRRRAGGAAGARRGSRRRGAGVVRRHARDGGGASARPGARRVAGVHAAWRYQRLGPLLHGRPHRTLRHGSHRHHGGPDRPGHRRHASPRPSTGVHASCRERCGIGEPLTNARKDRRGPAPAAAPVGGDPLDAPAADSREVSPGTSGQGHPGRDRGRPRLGGRCRRHGVLHPAWSGGASARQGAGVC